MGRAGSQPSPHKLLEGQISGALIESVRGKPGEYTAGVTRPARIICPPVRAGANIVFSELSVRPQRAAFLSSFKGDSIS